MNDQNCKPNDNLNPLELAKEELSQINQFLGLFGYQENDTVYLRHIKSFPKSIAIKSEVKYPLKKIPVKNKFGTYFVVNGQGHIDQDIRVGRAVWIEHDDIEKIDQLILWQKHNLPEPTIQIDTGGKSIHSYWIFETAISVAEWAKIQKGLINLTKADRSISNPSRVMRLPNCDYYDKVTGKLTGKSRIVGGSGKKIKPIDIQKVIRENDQSVQLPQTERGFKQIIISSEKTDQWVEKALIHINPDCAYDDWFNVGVSLVSYYGENEGLRLWDNWSSQGNKYKGYLELENKVKSFDLTKCKGIGLLFNIAKRYGFNYIPKNSSNTTNTQSNNKVNLDERSDNKVRSFIDLITKPKEAIKPTKINTLADTTYSDDDQLINIINEDKNKLIIMVDPTGLGKTTTISRIRWKLHNLAKKRHSLMANCFDEDLRTKMTKPSIFYIDQNHNNPSDAIIERDFYNLEPRAKSWQLDNTKKTASGLSYRHASVKEDGDLEGNCIRADYFIDAINKGLRNKISIPTKVTLANGGEMWASNQICGTCPNFLGCPFLEERLSILGHPKHIMDVGVLINGYQEGKIKERKPLIRCDISQVTENVIQDWDIAVIDEFDKALMNLSKFSFTQNQLDHDYGLLVHKYPVIEDRIKPIFIALKDLFEEAKKEHYALESDRIFARLNELDLNYSEILELWENEIAWQDELSREYKREDLFGETTKEGINLDVVNNAIGLILEAMVKDEPIKLSMDKFGKLTIFKRNGFNYKIPFKTIGLTATPLSKSTISKATGIPEERIIFVARETNLTMQNLTVNVITGISGIGSNKHTDKAQEKLVTFTKQRLSPEDTLLSGHKKYRDSYGLDSHYWGNDERGANMYQHKKNVTFLGLPYEHLGQAKITYELLTNSIVTESENDFEQFKRSLMENNIIQRLGRLRTIRRTELLTANILCKDLEIDFLTNYGYTVQKADVTDTEYLELMTPKQIVHYAIKQYLPCYVAQCLEKNNLPRLEDFLSKIKEKFQVSKSEISKAVKSLGLGFIELRKIFHSLITLYKENGNFLRTKIETVLRDVGSWFKDRFTKACSDLGLVESEQQNISPPPKKEFRWLSFHTNLLYELLGDLEVLVKRSDFEHIKRKYEQSFLEYCLSEYVSDNLIGKLSNLGCL